VVISGVGLFVAFFVNNSVIYENVHYLIKYKIFLQKKLCFCPPSESVCVGAGVD